MEHGAERAGHPAPPQDYPLWTEVAPPPAGRPASAVVPLATGGHGEVTAPVVHPPVGARAARVAGVAGVAGRGAVRLLDRILASVRRFFTGIGYFWLGAGHFLRRPRLWLLAVLPVVATAVAMVGLRQATVAPVEWLVGWLVGFLDGWPRALRWLVEHVVRWSVVVAVHLALTTLTIPLTMLFGAGFFPFITRSVVRRAGGSLASAPAPPWHRAAWVCLRQTMIVTVVLHVGWLVIVPVLWIPGVNLVAALAVGLLFNGFCVGLLVLAVPMHHHGLRTAREQWRFAWSHRAYTMGFGLMSLCALIVPVLSVRLLALLPVPAVLTAPGAALYLFTAPAALVGAVLLHRRIVAGAPGGRA